MKRKSSILLLLVALLCNCQETKKSQYSTENSKEISASTELEPPISYSDYVQSYITIDTAQIALVNVKVIDGTGRPTLENQTILIRDNQIVGLGSQNELVVPDGFLVLNGVGKTVIPGIIGTHNHLRLPQGAMLYTGPRLYLASGVTTIQTCGTGHPVEEIAIAKAIKAGDLPGSEIVNSGPYLTGPAGKSNFIQFTDEAMVRDTIRYWAKLGVKWFKVYRHTRPEDLEVIIDEAHKNGAKVTGHLCATTFEEAANLGIDAIEHGFIHSYDHAENKESGTCSGSTAFRSTLDIDSEEVKRIQQILIDKGVALSATPSIFEAQVPSRAIADQRALDAMAPFHKEAYKARQKRMLEQGDEWYFKDIWLEKSMEYALAFHSAGGLLTAGPDPGLHNMPGYGDQRNYELFIEAGFKTEEAIQVMTSNGAKLLGRSDIGIIAVGMRANLVLLNGDLEEDASNIRKVDLVFKDGKGFDSKKMIEEIKGHAGSETDNSLKYLGQRPPGLTPEVFAPNFISKPTEYEFGSVFLKDAEQFFYGVDVNGKAEIRYTQLENGVWSMPETIISHPTYGLNDPFLTPEEDQLFFISDLPTERKDEKKNHDIWYAVKEADGWSAPINAGPNINTPGNEYYISFTNEGTMYFSSNIGAEEGQRHDLNIYSAKRIDGVFQEPVKLGDAINTKAYEADVYVAPDESYLIFCGIRREGLGNGDLYISFKQEDGRWTKAKNMGPTINSAGHELCPFVSVDGKYFFFTSRQDIYWVDAGVIEHYR